MRPPKPTIISGFIPSGFNPFTSPMVFHRVGPEVINTL